MALACGHGPAAFWWSTSGDLMAGSNLGLASLLWVAYLLMYSIVSMHAPTPKKKKKTYVNNNTYVNIVNNTYVCTHMTYVVKYVFKLKMMIRSRNLYDQTIYKLSIICFFSLINRYVLFWQLVSCTLSMYYGCAGIKC